MRLLYRIQLHASTRNARTRTSYLTHYRPLPIADPGNCDREHRLFQHTLPRPDFDFSATECLTLNVSVPSAEARRAAAGPLPVVVLMHGGGFVTGSAHWPQYDMASLVERSEKAALPVVGVSIRQVQSTG